MNSPLFLSRDVAIAFRRRADEIHDAALKSFGLFVGDPTEPDHVYRPVAAVFFDPYRNRRNNPLHRDAFRAQGEYFRQYDDAGFVADPKELLRVYREIDDAGLEIVGMFHSHRRQPANFSTIDFRLHNPAFAWHLILSYGEGDEPVPRAFRVRKEGLEIGISADDRGRDSQLPYPGPEVRPLRLVFEGVFTTVPIHRVG